MKQFSNFGKYLSLSLIILMCASCKDDNDKQAYNLPSTFSVQFDTIRATLVKATVIPSNPKAYYLIDMFFDQYDDNGQLIHYTDQDLFELEKDIMKNMYELHLEQDPNADFADIFLYQGKRSLSFDWLAENTDYEYVILQVNPTTREPFNQIKRVRFHTAKIDSSDVKFNISYSGTNIKITPSNSDPYITLIDRFDYVYEHENLPDDFTLRSVRMYEDYDFVNALTKSGEKVINLDEGVSGMIDGEKYVLLVFGYNGEINTELTVSHFVYHRGGETEILHDY
ncbi:MAG: hypothetical protein IJU35_08550 [Paludibacteraceae bacterium]|nr:hypothetical protein [Paludibacteraceae bacterium]